MGARRREQQGTARRPRRRRHDAGDFRCAGCRLTVPARAPGTAHRNHCPNCLVSLHVDRRVPGDRAADCGGRMEPLGMAVRPDGEWLLIHECLTCGELSTNRIAGDDNARALVRLALKPLQDTTFAGRAMLAL
ncbi:RNHCP domain-containing protein [Streptomyces sp. NPDC052012]|uniref:RNHCP domain-containing protein n=1 Tax=Streptomyces sp. NPDC052012 TaxID=3155051 RepID=UPI00344C8FFE